MSTEENCGLKQKVIDAAHLMLMCI